MTTAAGKQISCERTMFGLIRIRLTLTAGTFIDDRNRPATPIASALFPLYTFARPMGETNHNLWAPWRMAYITSLHESESDAASGCFLCSYWSEPDRDAERHVVWRRGGCMAVFNRYPYTNGHMLVAPSAHTADLGSLSSDDLADVLGLVRDAQRLLVETVRAEGFNVGMNVGRCAGAGLPDHLHLHVVPRWSGDTNFMSVLGDARVMPQSLEALYAQMVEAAPRLGLPGLAGAPQPPATS